LKHRDSGLCSLQELAAQCYGLAPGFRGPFMQKFTPETLAQADNDSVSIQCIAQMPTLVSTGIDTSTGTG
jgi:hypothetical protein